MAKTLRNLETPMGNGASETPASADLAAFSQVDETAPNVRAALALADRSVTFGCGQWPHVPVAFDREAINLRMAQNALALAQARKGSGAWDDETLQGLADKAASAVGELVFQPTLLEEAVDNYLRRYVELPRKGGKTLDTSGWTSAEKRSPTVQRILGYSLETIIPVTISDGQGGELLTNFPRAGERFITVIADEIHDFIHERRPDNKKDMTKSEKSAKSTNGAFSAASVL